MYFVRASWRWRAEGKYSLTCPRLHVSIYPLPRAASRQRCRQRPHRLRQPHTTVSPARKGIDRAFFSGCPVSPVDPECGLRCRGAPVGGREHDRRCPAARRRFRKEDEGRRRSCQLRRLGRPGPADRQGSAGRYLHLRRSPVDAPPRRFGGNGPGKSAPPRPQLPGFRGSQRAAG